MRETWLRPNRRAIVFGCLPPLVAAAIGAWLAFQYSDTGNIWRAVGMVMIVVSAGMIGMLINQLRRPRIGFHDGCVQFYLRTGPPIEVPAQIVEAFFLGQGPAHLPAVSKQPQTVNLVARLSQRHTEWARQDVKPALGNWCDGYVTIRGAWCEPLDTEIVRKLNRRLKEITDAIENSRQS